jgi:hypothetical protein
VSAARGAVDLSSLPDGAEVLVPFELTYTDGEPVQVLVRRRGRRIDIDDRGRAVELAGRPTRWLEVAQAVVERDGLNVNRRGVVFVPVVVGREIEELARRIAEASLAVHAALLEVGEKA